MRGRRLRGVLGLVMLSALGAMVLGTASAQAGVFKINGGAALLAEVAGSQESLTTFLVPSRNLTLVCHQGEWWNGISYISYLLGGLLVQQYLNCLALSHTKGTELPCTVHDPKLTAIILPSLHNGKPYIIYEIEELPASAIAFLGGSCPLPEENPVKGSTAALVSTNNKVVNLLNFSPAIQSLLGGTLSFGGSAATVEGSATIKLTGAHAGLTFGIG
jgi:hypothetical protein